MTSFALFSVSFALTILLATCAHGIHVEPDDIVKTIESECGDIIDCVDIYKQPSLQNPLLRDHKIQLKPNKEPPKILHKLKGRNYSVPEQTWRRSGSCPEGTVPIRRTPTSADTEAAKHSLPFFSYAHPTDVTIQDEGKGKLEIAAAYGVFGPYHGASAAIPIWKVQVQPNEFSKSYLLIACPHDRMFAPIPGKDPSDIKNQIAVGMAVYPSVLGDDNPRLYIYATNEVWWLSINEVPIGYFDPNMFPVPFIESLHNQMGGRVLDTRPGGRHTMTPMGSGQYAAAGANNAATIGYYLAVDYEGGDLLDDPVNSIVTNSKCYDVKNLGPDLDHPGTDVAYGGPGGYYCDQ